MIILSQPICPRAINSTCHIQLLTYLEFDSRRRLCWSTDVAGLMLGVAQRDVLKSHWSSNLSSSSSVGPPTSWENIHSLLSLTSKASPWQTSFHREPTLIFTFVNHIHSGGQIPHLDAAVSVACEQVAPWPWAHSTGSLTFSDCKWGYCSTVNSLDLTDSAKDIIQMWTMGSK